MNETLDYIESYFENSLTAQERTQFEQRITTDAAFANEVAFYVQARQVLRQELVQQKERSWKAEPVAISVTAPVVPIRKPPLLKRWMAVAASVVVAVGTYLSFLLGSLSSAQKLAKIQIAEYSNTMDASQDTLQQSIAKLKEAEENKANLDTAAQLLVPYTNAHPNSLDGIKNLGIVYLLQEKYDSALKRFEKLESIPQVQNEGPYFKAIARVLRDAKGDKEEARKLLEQVATDPGQSLENRERAKQLQTEL